MGVPAFFRWLSKKYPSVIVTCNEVTPKDVNGKLQPVDPSEPNPNGIEFDNLYLDMNGIIHPCTHPEDKPAPRDEDEMMVAIFEAIDRMLNIVRPRKLLYMAVDGVVSVSELNMAPRAKMNQQRSRRFRASKETAEKVLEVAKIRAKLELEGAILPPPKDDTAHFDSNCITPGTPFMDRLSKCLHYYAHSRLNNDPAWKDLKIILSDANVPGEGEHKIMDFIRKQRDQPNHDPDTVHCLCGADADLMMLGLATHEPHFYIIREEFKPNMDRPCEVCGTVGHNLQDCQGLEPNQEVVRAFSSEVQFIFVRISVLREYLKRELEMPGLPFTYDFERAVDDWVFMCFFVGNDFLPHLPSLEIREGAIDRLVGLYKKAVYKTEGFLTDNGDVALNRVQLIMSELGVVEDEIFKKRQQTEEMFRMRDKAKRKRMKMYKARERPSSLLSGQFAPVPLGRNVSAIVNPRQEAYQQRMQSMHTSSETNGTAEEPRGVKRTAVDAEVDSDDEPEVHDEVRLWEAGFKDRYYESKFDVDSDNKAFRNKVALEYVKGLCWVLKYYYQGCPSWEWYFPYHYAPFASDFCDIAAVPVVWPKGTKPFKPLEQLMSVFPAASKQHVPEPWSQLMIDPESPIIDFYPEDFKIDLNGKKFAWQGVALLPFVDEERLHKALESLYPELTMEEVRRNSRGDDRFYVCQSSGTYSFLKGLYESEANYHNESTFLADGMQGRALLAEDVVTAGGTLTSPVRGLEVIRNNTVVCVRFRDAKYSDDHVFSMKRLTGATDPPTVLKPQNLTEEAHRNWKPQIGMVRATQSASLGRAGHRMLGHFIPFDRSNSPGQYSAVAPPAYTTYGARNDRYSNSQSKKNDGHQDNRPPSLFAQQRRDQRDSNRGHNQNYQRNSSRFNDSSSSNSRSRGYAVSYNIGSSSGQHRPPYQSRNPQQNYQSYQPYQAQNRTGGPRPSGFYQDKQRNSSSNRRPY